ncbi:V-type ATP synthase subunit B [Athalassotoga saccharophila]|uniref:V-type ATP synthase subunit B n=1 Tax=Athalassotoga saccharophila TaxID=1441386 RepID=UPI00137B5B06|nr:V-type ATP synthase subunit B [Athalassotoga saccharophila]BBJ28345.1 V-type ATP synthase subunit B [Athalassotoga saccharophila]
MPSKEYVGLSQINGPLVFVENPKGVGYNEVVEIITENQRRLGQVVQISDKVAMIQVFEGTSGLTVDKTRVKFLGRPLMVKVSDEMLGREFNGIGEPIDKGPDILNGESRDINGSPINPASRMYPRNFIQTGISAIDALMTLIRGQKLPIFSGNGLPHNRIAVQITKQAKLKGEEAGNFAIVFAAMGIKHDEANFIRESLEQSGAIKNTIMFLNLADDPAIERIATPRVALTAAEYLAFDKNLHVLVLLTDMTNYCEALRELATARGEVPSRKGYPGYLYSDLASIYERAGMIKDKNGSITQIPILSMPNDDITHPIPDLTGYITEGQIVLNRDLNRKGIYPPIGVLQSLSRLMKDGIGKGYTRDDHPHVSSQLFASYSKVQEVKALASIIGEEELTDSDRRYLRFGEAFENEFINQGEDEDRSIEETLDLGWKLLGYLPKIELTRVSEKEIADHYKEIKEI